MYQTPLMQHVYAQHGAQPKIGWCIGTCYAGTFTVLPDLKVDPAMKGPHREQGGVLTGSDDCSQSIHCGCSNLGQSPILHTSHQPCTAASLIRGGFLSKLEGHQKITTTPISPARQHL